MTFRVVASPLYKPSHLALARRYDRLHDAIAAMGEGAVVSDDGTNIVAFHQRHLRLMERLATLPDSPAGPTETSLETP